MTNQIFDIETDPARPRPTDQDGQTRLDDAVVLDVGLDDLPVGSTRLARVDGHRVCVARTATGVYAVDHACPHEGYGLTQGSLDGDLLTCAWHNWKFDVTTGACVIGEEEIPVHDVDVADDGSIAVRVRRPEPAAERARLLASLERGIERDYVGQIARDVARLLGLGVEPAEIAAVAVRYGAPRGEWGWGHAIAALTDCLAMVDLYEGDQRAIPLVQGISFVAHDERGRPPRTLPEPASATASTYDAFVDAVEREELGVAQACVLGALERGADADELTEWFVTVVSTHLLSYGHGAIYTQKAFELLDLIGWQHAPIVLGHLVTSIVTGTREDTLPYHRPFGRELGPDDLAGLTDAVRIEDAPPASSDRVAELREALLGPDRAVAARATAAAIGAGAAIDQVLDVIVGVVAERLLRHDTAVEFDLDDDFGWLDITHGLTYAHAARSLLARRRAALGDVALRDRRLRADMVALTLHCAFLANWTGRHEWHTEVGDRVSTTLDEQLAAATTADELRVVGEALQRRSHDDVHTAPIHVEHAVKNSLAAHLEAQRTGDGTVLAAVARYFDGPRQERGVRATTHRSIEFVAGRLRR